eukprot:Skav221860  [mRNA]  locus=scaffold1175:384264:387593:- [translate_table: standard]
MLLENVKGMKLHPDYHHIIDVMTWCGYRLVHEWMLDISRVAPVHRERLLQLLVRVEETPQTLQPLGWGHFPKQICATWDALFPSSDEQLIDWTPSAEVLKKYWALEYLPPQADANSIQTFRVPSMDHTLPTFLASYGHQHEIDDHHLRHKGLLGCFCTESNTIRWFKPFELSLLHGQLHTSCFPKPSTASWQSIGNEISVFHATLALANWARYAFPLAPPIDLHRLTDHMHNDRIRASASTLVEDDHAWYVGYQMECQQMMARNTMVHKCLGDNLDITRCSINAYLDPDKGFCNHVPSSSIEVPSTIPVSITPTCPMEVEEPTQSAPAQAVRWTPIVLIMHGKETQFLVHADVTWTDLLALWPIEMSILDQNQRSLSPSDPLQPAVLRPVDDVEELMSCPMIAPTPVILTRGGELFVVMSANKPFGQLKQEFTFLQTAQDAKGIIPDDFVFNKSVLLHQPTSLLWVQEIQRFLLYLPHVTVESCFPTGTDSLLLDFRGSPEAIEHALTFWFMALTNEWLRFHGRTFEVQVRSDTQVRVSFPALPHATTPQLLFKEAIQDRLIATAVLALDDCRGAYKTDFKHQGRRFPTVHLAQHTDMGEVVKLLTHAIILEWYGHSPSIISIGKRRHEGTHIEEIFQQLQASSFPRDIVTLHIIHPLIGGAVSTKHEMHQHIKDGLSSLFLEAGFSPNSVAAQVQSMMSQVGTHRVLHLVFAESNKQKKFLELCDLCNIHLPNPKHAPKNKMAKHDHKKPTQRIDVKQYKLAAGYFRLANGDQAPMLEEFSPFQVGVSLISADDAERWYHSGPILPDELAMVIIGDMPEQVTTKMTKITVPATNAQGQSVLLRGFLHQLGEKLIQLPAETSKSVATKATTVCAITAWSDDFAPDQWKDLCQAPVRVIKNMLKHESLDHLVGVPWGRTFKKGRNAAQPSDCTSLQFHVEISTDQLPLFLKHSGFNRIFCTPKDPTTGKPDDRWRVIWYDCTRESIQPKILHLPGLSGYVRGLKSTGVRVQDPKILVLEQAVQSIQTEVQQQAQKHEARITAFEATVQEQHQTTSAVLQQISQDFQTTLKGAIAHQDNKINTTMEELKQLFLRTNMKSNTPTRDESDMTP